MSRPEPLHNKDRRPTAWDMGFSARRSGAKASENPYKLTGLRHRKAIQDELNFYWNEGWLAGEIKEE